MGHYDSCYEYDNERDRERAEEKLKEDKSEARHEIEWRLTEMSLSELLLLRDIAKNLDSFQTVIKIIKGEKL